MPQNFCMVWPPWKFDSWKNQSYQAASDHALAFIYRIISYIVFSLTFYLDKSDFHLYPWHPGSLLT